MTTIERLRESDEGGSMLCHEAARELEALQAENAALRKDKERLDWLDGKQGSAVVSDDHENWAVTGNSFATAPTNPPQDVEAVFFIEQAEWKKGIRPAIDAAMNP